MTFFLIFFLGNQQNNLSSIIRGLRRRDRLRGPAEATVRLPDREAQDVLQGTRYMASVIGVVLKVKLGAFLLKQNIAYVIYVET